MSATASRDRSLDRNGAWENRSAWILFALSSYFPLFLNLDAMPLQQWDEARQAVSALEMVGNGNWLVNHYNGSPDMWSTKPPLLVWGQALLMSILGPDELAVRLPSAISALLTGLLLMWVCARWLRRPWLGLIATIVLFTSEGYMHHHAARHGDYDAPMTFFMMLQSVTLFRFSMNGSRRALGLFFVGLTLGVLTKSIQALLFLPGLAIFLLLAGAWKSVMIQRITWIGLASSVLLVASFYLVRENANPGYINAVIANELGNRYSTVIEGHRGPWHFYLDRLIHLNFTSFHLLVPIGIAAALGHRDALLRRWGVLTVTLAVSYLMIISGSSTKCEWYDVPAYPLLAMLAAFVLHAVAQWAHEQVPGRLMRWNIVPSTFLLVVLSGPWWRMVNTMYVMKDAGHDHEFYAPSHYFREVLSGKQATQASVLATGLVPDRMAHLLFYMERIRSEMGPMERIDAWAVRPGMHVLAFEQPIKERIEREYGTRLIEEWYNIRVYEIVSTR